jgi:hypothetical protein
MSIPFWRPDPQLPAAYHRALRSAHWRFRWWRAKHWMADRPELVAAGAVLLGWVVIIVALGVL